MTTLSFRSIRVRAFSTTAAFLMFVVTAWAGENVIYSFPADQDSVPETKLVLRAGRIYGATTYAGMFELSPNGSGGWNYETIYGFDDNLGFPSGEFVFDSQGNQYGTASGGGEGFYGVVYELSPSSSGQWTLTFIPLGNNDGRFLSGLTIDAAGNLYGVAQTGGTYMKGLVYKLSPNSDGTWTDTILYNFKGHDDGYLPTSEVTLDSAGNLYGTTGAGGNYHHGTVYELSPTEQGQWSEKILYSFNGAASEGIPESKVWIDSAGSIYGTTAGTGENQWGTVYRLAKNASGSWVEKNLHTFIFGEGDGANPTPSGLTADSSGNLYGTTIAGGAFGHGVIYKLTALPDNKWGYEVVHSFSGGSDGAWPEAGVTFDNNGTYYGTTTEGGANNEGVVYQVGP